ncbi:ABC transporter permease [Bacillus pseudomycoides]|uniref:ABC transporter permease n=1 Tax=Bacillus pseudomycoides TaxID=64104 RepID=A0AA91VD33_9BACI|nr:MULTISPECIES: ABC transporter permease [Bacillus]PEB47455.1 ABC transporter permease [Bacillus sp. AFS098217]PED82799.1 ABC transporter permease [Bacillus pseudomycoides]PEU10359.1 ABC transporter permease [Bacillus sp. AFS014408]PEU13323.1 ABC transporter permease [Bacillus sp. AFS019443]PFW62931.1 ABC transporter permease [Bacillus sp. AFS075034]
MKQLMISEFERIFSRKKTKVMFLVFTLFLIGDAVFLDYGKLAIYSSEGAAAPLSQLNFQVTLAKEIYFVLALLVFPILFIDSFNGERSSGAYRLVCIRPIERTKLLVAKWLTQFILAIAFLFLTFIFGYIYGKLYIPTAEYTTFLHQDIKYNAAEAFLYTLKFYGVFVLITATILLLASFVSLWMPNVVLSFFGTIGLLFGALYIHDSFSYFLSAGQEAIRILSNGDSIFYLVNGTILVVCMLLSFITWKTKDLYE